MTPLHLTRKFSTRVEPTEKVKDCAAMFGIGIDADHEIVLYENLEVLLGPRRVIYVTGDSGAGKSCLLRDVAAEVENRKDLNLVRMPDLADLPDKPLVDQFDLGLKETLELLNFVGVSEAFIYLRKPKELSDGQRYRFLLAMAIDEARRREGITPVILIDEFLAFLDRETARNVAYQTRRVATAHKFCVVVATTHADIAADLQPNTTYTMRLNLPVEVKHRALAGL